MILGKIATMRKHSFKKPEFVVNYGDFICVACILCAGISENFKLQLGYQLD